MSEGVADERKREKQGALVCLWELGGWWLEGHENVNLDVSEAIFLSLGMQSRERLGGSVSGLNLNHIVQQTKCYK